jgi:prolyl-tRNA editing enzyme YbaK/EbsC (Cys-tRNA(Pro) deacylase)
MEGGSKISNQKFRDVFGQKATMVKAKDLESKIGHPVGGVCPFALKDDVRLYFDETLKKHQVVFTAAGTEMTTVELTLDDKLCCKKQNILSYIIDSIRDTFCLFYGFSNY